MAWLQLRLNASAVDADYFAELLQQLGALSVTYVDAADQPLYEPGVNETPLWQATDVIALFPAETDIAALTSALQQNTDRTLPALRADPLEDKDWIRAWMDHYQPMHFGHGLWICPSHSAPPEPHAINVLLDPGLAFGTGTHPTTAMCLRWLAAHPPRERAVIDYGCGSGVLAVAAAKLGAREIYAIDNDPQALLATTRNAQQNAVDALIHVAAPHTELPTVTLLIANILARPLVELAPRFATLVQAGGNIVLSGILSSQAATVVSAYQEEFTLFEFAQQEDWVCLAGRRH
jgi:ribosomal protein L11 methyltransferase